MNIIIGYPPSYRSDADRQERDRRAYLRRRIIWWAVVCAILAVALWYVASIGGEIDDWPAPLAVIVEAT